jgi:hypothetical protein
MVGMMGRDASGECRIFKAAAGQRLNLKLFLVSREQDKATDQAAAYNGRRDDPDYGLICFFSFQSSRPNEFLGIFVFAWLCPNHHAAKCRCS